MNDPDCNKCGQPFSRSNIAADSPTCEDCLIEELENYPILPRRRDKPDVTVT